MCRYCGCNNYCCGINIFHHLWWPSHFHYCSVLGFTGPVNNILIVRGPNHLALGVFSNSHASSRRHGSPLPPPLEKYVNMDEDANKTTVSSNADQHILFWVLLVWLSLREFCLDMLLW
ncbi:hypothetical protein ACOSQ4_004943 [Xanthoceras sorbifolium]